MAARIARLKASGVTVLDEEGSAVVPTPAGLPIFLFPSLCRRSKGFRSGLNKIPSMLLPGLLILAVFLVMAGLMMTKRMPALLALPFMAVAIGLIAGLFSGLPWTASEGVPCLRFYLFETILKEGSSRLKDLMMYGIFGAILSQVVMRQGIAERIIRVAAEYAGDRKMLLAFLITGAVAWAFLTVNGLGAAIMVGSLVLPILMGSGLSPTYACGLMLFGIAIGGIFNPVNLGFYVTVLKLDLEVVKRFSLGFGILLGVTAVAFLTVQGVREKRNFAWAALEPEAVRRVPLPALLTPVLPILLIWIAQWPIIPAFLAGILYGCLTTEPVRLIPNLTAATLEGLKDISPVLGLFMGIGMTLNALMDPVTRQVMDPFIQAVVPTRPFTYVLFFAALAPLTLYRGPLNLYGLGAGFAALLMNSQLLPPAAIMGAFMAVGQVQSVCDPTNTHNVWMASFTHTSTEKILKTTLPYVWGFVLAALIYAVTVGRVL
ncbi:MAG: transporter [Candidatus Eremiobacterota bacterium]